MPQATELYEPVHPGEILAEEFLHPYELTARGLAKELGVEPAHVDEILEGGQRISADTALRLGRFFGTTAEFWLNLQTHYDLRMAERDQGTREGLEGIRSVSMRDLDPDET